MKQRKKPQRMCVACREMRDKKDLLRIVRVKREGEEGAFDVVYDRTGKLPGRGCYLCADVACLQKAEKTRAINRALEAVPPGELFAQLEREILRRDL